MIWPLLPMLAAAIDKVGSAPTKSKTTSAPTPPVRRMTSAAVDASDTRVRSAPRSDAWARRDSSVSTATIVAPEVARRICRAMWPRPPTPMTTTVELAERRSRDSAIAW